MDDCKERDDGATIATNTAANNNNIMAERGMILLIEVAFHACTTPGRPGLSAIAPHHRQHFFLVRILVSRGGIVSF